MFVRFSQLVFETFFVFCVRSHRIMLELKQRHCLFNECHDIPSLPIGVYSSECITRRTRSIDNNILLVNQGRIEGDDWVDLHP